MADQKFSATEREALWQAHGKKCAYTGEPIEINNFHIDHILPENLADKPLELEGIKKALGLNPEFDPRGFENLLPCKPGVNLQKGSLVLEPAPFHYFLGIAASKKKAIEINLDRIERRNSRGKALILLQQHLERGDVSFADVARILEDHAGRPEEMFRLIEHMKFSDKTEVASIAKAEIDELRKRPIRLGENDHIQGLTFGKGTEQETFVRTCEEYDAAIAAGHYPQNNTDLKLSVFFSHQCGLLRALREAALPELSYIDEPRVGVADLHLLPSALFPFVGEAKRHIDDASTYQSKVDNRTFVVKRVKQNAICVEEPAGMGQLLIEVVRADFNADGIEDILLFEYCYATHGTLGFGGIKIITRKGPASLFESVSRL